MEVLDPPALAYGNILYTATITGTYTVSDSNDPAVVTPMVLELLPSGAQRDVDFPRPSMPLGGRVQYVRNAASVGGYTLRIRAGTSASATLSTIATMQPGESGLCVYWQDPDDSIWKLRYFSLAFNAATTLGTLSAGIAFAAGISYALDASACATGQALIKMGDNLAIALEVKEGSNSYLKFVTTNSGEKVVFGQPAEAVTLTTTTSLSTDTIAERTSAAGVTVDGCLIKDGVAASAGSLASGAVFSSTEQTGTGSSQNIAHGFGSTPSMAWAVVTDSGAGVFTVTPGTHTSTNCVFTVSLGIKYRVYAIK